MLKGIYLIWQLSGLWILLGVIISVSTGGMSTAKKNSISVHLVAWILFGNMMKPSFCCFDFSLYIEHRNQMKLTFLVSFFPGLCSFFYLCTFHLFNICAPWQGISACLHLMNFSYSARDPTPSSDSDKQQTTAFKFCCCFAPNLPLREQVTGRLYGINLHPCLTSWQARMNSAFLVFFLLVSAHYNVNISN